jgi:hypothetical protein
MRTLAARLGAQRSGMCCVLPCVTGDNVRMQRNRCMRASMLRVSGNVSSWWSVLSARLRSRVLPHVGERSPARLSFASDTLRAQVEPAIFVMLARVGGVCHRVRNWG